ncbi:MAG: GntR family transcriptional regulator [Planctomycetota bacterium]
MRDSTRTRAANGTGRNSGNLLAMLRSSIVSGKVAPGDFLPTVRQLSDDHGVSRGTAWRALKALVAEGLVAAQPRHGYRVLAHAGNPDRGTPLAYVLSEDNIISGWDVYYRTLSASIEEVAATRGWTLMRMISSAGKEEDLFGQLLAAKACGLILDTANVALLERAKRSGLPAVMVDAWRPGADFDAVVQDDFSGGQLAARHLVGKGCRRVAWFGPVSDSYHAYARFGGASSFLAGEGLKFSQVVDVDLEDPSLVDHARELLDESHRPAAVITLWRPVISAVVAAARELRLEIGRDFEMVGWMADEVYSEGYAPIFGDGPVPTAVTWSTVRMAELALARLAERRANPTVPTACMTVPASLRLAAK